MFAGTPRAGNTDAVFAIGPSDSTFTVFNGTGFTYSGGLFTGGTINRIDSVVANHTEFVFLDINMPVAQFRAFMNAGNSQGFLAAALAGNDTLIGSQFDDYLQGFKGNDFIAGDASLGGGNDTLDGGLGADTMFGSEGNDFYFVDNAKDFVQGETSTVDSGIDTVQSTLSYVLGLNLEHLLLTGKAALSGTGNDLANQIVGNTGNNILLGLGANDSLEGGAGNDKLDGGSGDDAMFGGAGNDSYIVDSKSDQAVELIGGKAGGVDTVFSSADITLGDNIENLTLTGSANILASGNSSGNVIVSKNTASGGNSLNGLGGNDTINGSIANDVISGGAGADLMAGGAGSDTYGVEDPADKVVETLTGKAGGTDTVVYAGVAGYTLGANVESLSLFSSKGATFGIGNSLGNVIMGNSDANLLDGKAGVDMLIGLDGDDIYVVDNVLDVVDETNGMTNVGLDTIRSSIDFNLTDNATTVLGELENLILVGKALIGTGNILGNQITGNAGKNTLIGLQGNDTLDGGSGNDTLSGGDDNDLYIVDSKLDVVVESGTGTADQINSAKIAVDISAMAGIENITLLGKLALTATGNDSGNVIIGNVGANKLFGGADADTLIGGAGNDRLDGGVGVDRMVGGDGNDTYIIELGGSGGIADIIDESSGDGVDTVISSSSFTALVFITAGDVENLILAPGAGNSIGHGNDLANVLTGNEGDNIITGGFGNDTITGGAGADEIAGASDSDFDRWRRGQRYRYWRPGKRHNRRWIGRRYAWR